MAKLPKGVLVKWYYEDGLTQTEIAEKFGPDVKQWTVSYWMQKDDIAPGKTTEAAAEASRVQRANFRHWPTGHECWEARYRDEMDYVSVHRLAAVAWSGFDEVAGNDVHHKNEVPWDNREENLTLLPPDDHRSHHAEEARRNESGQFT